MAVEDGVAGELGEELAAGECLFGLDFVAEAGVAGAGAALEHLDALVAVLKSASNGAARAAGDEPGQSAAELPGRQARQPPIVLGDRIHAEVSRTAGVDPLGQCGDVLDSCGAGPHAPGNVVALMIGRLERVREQVGLVGRLAAFQDGDGSCDGIGDDRGGGRAMDAFALEGQSVKPVAVDTAVGVALGAHAAAPRVFDYWREGVIPTVHYSLNCPQVECGRGSASGGPFPQA
ncbi:hypothetical protein [Streptomyces sp. SP17KL33]|uniref:hypothetical protein n=1 Tax=Streptomyces sp. SP17KL33 TaxID=3002534 RepID=UPI002E796987|nr:hypothetical protein [Streptomyces sp. SP17KL33]MEE1833702.1 hypothetical protein [Streptomyces sp. SP17KL33]